MPVVPTFERKATLDTAAQLTPRTDINEAPVRAMETAAQATRQAGQQFAQLATTFGDKIAEQEREKRTFDTAIEFENLKQQQSAEDLDASDTISADGAGFAEGRLKSFNARFQPFLDKLPEEERGRYMLEATRLRGGLSRGAAQAERAQRLTWAGQQVDSNLEGGLAAVTQNPESLDSTVEAYSSFVQASNLPFEKKMELIKKGRDALQGAAFGRRLEQNDPSDGVQHNAMRASVMVDSRASDAVWSSLIKQESGGNPRALSHAGAIGLAQVMPGTARGIARELGDDNVAKMSDGQLRTFFFENPEVNVRYGKFYLNKQLKAFNGDMEAALVAYNGGPGRAQKWLASGRDDSVLPKETRQYYKAILGRVNLMGSTGLATYTRSGPVRVNAGGASESALQTRGAPDGLDLSNDGDQVQTYETQDAVAEAAKAVPPGTTWGGAGSIKVTGNPEADRAKGADEKVAGMGQPSFGAPAQSRQGVPDGVAPTGARTFQGQGKYTPEELAAADREVEPARQRSLKAGYLPSQLDIAGEPLPGQTPQAAGHDDDGDLAVTVSVPTKDGKWINVESVKGGKPLTKAEVKAAAAAGAGTVYDSKEAAVKAGGTVENLDDATDARTPATQAAAAVEADPEVERASKRATEKYQRRWSAYNDPEALGLPPRPETYDPNRESFKMFEARQKAWDAEFKRRGASMRREDSDRIAEERAAGAEEREAKREAREARTERRQERQDQEESHRNEIARLERMVWQNDPKAVDEVLKAYGDGTIRNRQEWERIVGQNEGVLGELIKRGVSVSQKAKATSQAQRREQAAVREMQKDDIASLRETGQGVGELGDERIRKALGDDVADEHARERANALRYHQATSGMETQTKAEIEGRINGLAPRPGAGFVDAQRTYADARRAADELYRLRERDPAASVDKDPGVRQAYDAIRSGRLRPEEGVAALAEARVQAQRQAGIPEADLAPVTRAEAQDLLAPYDNAPPGNQKKVLLGIVKSVTATFGKNADRVMGVMLDLHRQDEDLRRQAGKMMRDLAAGRPLTPQQGQVLDNGLAVNAEAAALGRLDAKPAPAAAAPERRSPIPDGARNLLIQRPELAAQFDAKYGAGSAKGILGVYGLTPPKP